ncbi:MAG: lipid carrier--UDP-N-acetylgalactosaminyltransferase [Gammaproteobacteria bacterium]|nr:lipid carrier--UDP-N-acetylgalactosaminyltransferase [Gammaproteobacteria bacterium]|tara:strand:- start:821 stop:1486 length:666 start_codon:yes stop_codon:yes gene_type:complete
MIRILDIFLSLFAILILLPFFLILIFCLRFSGEGEIFYLQKRIGKHGKSFDLLKFATMLKESPNKGTGDITVKNDPRILPLGKVLRKTKINELPQLLNILFGNMSFVGPRPLAFSGYKNYPEHLKSNLEEIKPGLSGLASLILRNEEEILSKSTDPIEFHSKILTPFKAETEIWFFNKKSIFNYFIIIFLTIWVVLFSKSRALDFFFKKRPEMPKDLKDII